MNELPKFMKNEKNIIDQKSQITEYVKEYFYYVEDDSQIAFWTSNLKRESKTHQHEFNDYMVIVSGCICLNLNDKEHILRSGDDIHIPKTPQLN